MGGEDISLLLIHDLGTRWGWVVSVTPRPRFTPTERSPGTQWTGSLVGLRAGLDTDVTWKISWLTVRQLLKVVFMNDTWSTQRPNNTWLIRVKIELDIRGHFKKFPHFIFLIFIYVRDITNTLLFYIIFLLLNTFISALCKLLNAIWKKKVL
jgi:hypothetical protein